jgi:hypothetical protein
MDDARVEFVPKSVGLDEERATRAGPCIVT